MSILRCNAVRNLGGTLNPKLFEYSQVGTKDLIHEYFTEVIKSLEYVSSSPNDKISLEKKLEFFTETRHAFGRTALLCSGGAGLGCYHFGVFKSLYEEGLLPKIIAGTSVGSKFAAFVCCRQPSEMPHVLTSEGTTFKAFYKEGPEKDTVTKRIQRFFKKGHFMDINVL